MVYHVLNRGNGRRTLFGKDADFAAFIKLLGEALERFPTVDLLAYCLMSNHWHLLLRPRTDQALPRLMAWLTVTHARRHHLHYPNPGSGHVYQGRFKSFPVQSDDHFLAVARYIHANPLRAGIVKHAEDWAWSDITGGARLLPRAPWPVDRPRGWVRRVNEAMPEPQANAIEASLRRGTPFGSEAWKIRTARRLNLESTLRPRGRPKKPVADLSPGYRRKLQRAQNGDKSR
jgi:putative transposase